MAQIRVTMNRAGIEALKRDDITKWLLNDILEPAKREAQALVNVDFGILKGSIGTAVDPGPVGFLFAGTDYAVWQEFEPESREYLGSTLDSYIPGVGKRKRKGGKPFLRPGVIKALQPFTR